MEGQNLKLPTNHDQTTNSKCGEIFVSKNTGSLLFYCVFCNDFYKNVEIFTNHIKELHFFLNVKVVEEISAKKLEDTVSYDDKEFIIAEDASESKIGIGIYIEEVRVEDHPNCFESLNIENIEVDSIYDRNSSESIEIKLDENRFINKKERRKPKRNKSDDKKVPKGFWKCQICNEFLKSNEKNLHTKTHDVVKRFICETCGKGYKNKFRFDTHTRTHTGERPYKCEFCHLSFTCPELRKQHNKTHFGLRPFTCSYCAATFTTRNSLRIHEFMHTNNGKKNVPCDLCEKKFSTELHLQSHRKRHNSEKKAFQCTKCPRGFASKYACNAHERLDHLGQYNYKCDYCDKVFIRLYRKRHHEKTHTRVGQPFPCDLCTKKYANREGLFKHKKRIHNSNKPMEEFKCNKCGEVFNDKIIFNEHCKQHALKDYIFACEECEARFNTEAKLDHHKSNFHILQNTTVDKKVVRNT